MASAVARAYGVWVWGRGADANANFVLLTVIRGLRSTLRREFLLWTFHPHKPWDVVDIRWQRKRSRKLNLYVGYVIANRLTVIYANSMNIRIHTNYFMPSQTPRLLKAVMNKVKTWFLRFRWFDFTRDDFILKQVIWFSFDLWYDLIWVGA